MITKQAIYKALEQNIIELTSSIDSKGVMCTIGNYSFYFDRKAIDFDDPAEYKATTPLSHIVNEIFDAILRFEQNKRYNIEYNYCCAYIMFQLKHNGEELSLYDIKNDSGKYRIPVSWTVYSTITVEADNLGEAVDIAREKINELPLCTKGTTYVEDSYSIDVDDDEDALNAQDYTTNGDVIIRKNGKIEIIH